MALTPYAQAHLVMVDIDQRFEAVIARHPKRDTERMRWRTDHARNEGRAQRNEFMHTLRMFDAFVHRQYTPP